ncbi:putative disease resistance protein RGA1 [Trifolium repens]|nr:putative disease resistance protein RGA1 [Trifolium repens]
MSNFGICAILYQSSPVPSLHRSFNVGHSTIVRLSREVRCRIPSGKHRNPLQQSTSRDRRDCRLSQIFSGKYSSSSQLKIFRVSSARLKGSFGNSFNFGNLCIFRV